MKEKINDEKFYCYSYNLKNFIKSAGIDYISCGRNKNNGLKYYLFLRDSNLNKILTKWDEFKEFLSTLN